MKRCTPPLALNLVSVCIAMLLCVICAPVFMSTAYAVDIPNSGDDGNAHWTWDEATKTITVTAKDGTDGVMTETDCLWRLKKGGFSTEKALGYSWREYHLPEAEHIIFKQNAQGTPVTVKVTNKNQTEFQKFFGDSKQDENKRTENFCRAVNLKTADLTALKCDVSNMPTNVLLDYGRFFGRCHKLEEVILSNNTFGNDHYKNFQNLFAECNNLQHIYGATYDKQSNSWTVDKSEATSGVKYLNDTNVISTQLMFMKCESLASFNASLFPNKLKSPQYTYYMFKDCIGLTKLNLKGITCENSTDMEAMFANCSQVPTFDLSSFNTAKCKTMSYTFFHCGTAKELDLSSFDTSNVTDMSHMFQHSNCLEKIIFSNKFNTSKVKTMESMFSGVMDESPDAPKAGNFVLKQLDLSTFDTHTCENFNNMFSGLRALETLKFGDKFATNGERQAMQKTFAGDTALKELTVGKEFEFKYDCALPEPNFGKAKWARKGKELTSPTWTSKQLTGTKTTKSIYKPNAAADSDDSVTSGTIVAVAALWNLTLDTDGGTIENLDAYQPCDTTLCKHKNKSKVWEIREGATVKEVPAPTKKGYAFRGWVSSDTDSNIMRLWFFDTKDNKDKASTMQRDTTLTALWEKEDTSSKHNQPSGGSSLPELNPVTPTIPTPTPKPEQHTTPSTPSTPSKPAATEIPQKEICPAPAQTSDKQHEAVPQKNITIINNYGHDNSTFTFGAKDKDGTTISLKGNNRGAKSLLPGTSDNASIMLLASMVLIGSAAGLATSNARRRSRKAQKSA